MLRVKLSNEGACHKDWAKIRRVVSIRKDQDSQEMMVSKLRSISMFEKEFNYEKLAPVKTKKT
jgi:hypothetical protein